MLFCPILAGKWAARGVSAIGILKASLIALLVGVVALALVSQVGVTLWQLALPLLLVGIGMGGSMPTPTTRRGRHCRSRR